MTIEKYLTQVLKKLEALDSKICKEGVDEFRKVVLEKFNTDEGRKREVLPLLKTHFQLLWNYKIITTRELAEEIGIDLLEEYGIYTVGFNKVKDGDFIFIGDAKGEASGFNKVMLFDRAEVLCRDFPIALAYDTSKLTISDGIFVQFHTATVNARGCRGEIFGNGSVTQKKCLIEWNNHLNKEREIWQP